MSEGFDTWILRKSIEIDTNDYSELSNKNELEVLEYLRENSSFMPFCENGIRDENFSLFDALLEQEEIKNSEKNYSTDIHIEK